MPNRTLALAAIALIGCASGTASSRASASSKDELAAEAVATAMSRARWEMVTRAIGEAFIQIWEKQAAMKGKALSPEFKRVAMETMAGFVSYEEAAAFMASAYVRYFSEEDLRVILAYQRTPTFQRQMDLFPKIMNDTSQWAQRILASRDGEIQAKIAARLQEKDGTRTQ